MTSLSRSLQEHQSILLGKPWEENCNQSYGCWKWKNGQLATGRTFSDQPASLKESDLSLLLQISLVADHQDNNGGAGQRPGVCQPVGQTIERLPELIQYFYTRSYILDSTRQNKPCLKIFYGQAKDFVYNQASLMK